MPNTLECPRCKSLGRASEHPLTSYYKDASGKPLKPCRKCRRELSRIYYRKYKEEAAKVKELAPDDKPETGRITVPEFAAARTIVSIESPAGPKIALWRCMSCYAKAVTRATGNKAPAFPESWRHMSLLVQKRQQGVILCGPCSGILLKAKRVMERVAERMRTQS